MTPLDKLTAALSEGRLVDALAMMMREDEPPRACVRCGLERRQIALIGGCGEARCVMDWGI